MDKRFYKPQPIHRWVVAIFESQARFPPPAVNDMMKGLVDGCQEVGKDSSHIRNLNILFDFLHRDDNVPDECSSICQWAREYSGAAS